MTLFELCADTVRGAEAGCRIGVDRIELCAQLDVGGTTPLPADLHQVLGTARVPVHVMIRSRGGDFVYSGPELDLMEGQLARAAELGAHGFVFGALDEAGQPDLNAMQRLMDAAGGLPVTFHRAFDEVDDPDSALEALVELGVQRILTSGGAPTAWAGRERIAETVQRAAGRLVVIAGGGVRADHARELVSATGVTELHGSVPIGPDQR